MTDAPLEVRLGTELDHHTPEILNAWMDALRRDPVCQPAAVIDELAVRSAPVLEALARALRQGVADPAAPHFREAVRELSFVGGWLAAREATASLAVKYVRALGDHLRDRLPAPPAGWGVLRRLEHELQALTVETYCLSQRSGLRQRQQEMLQRCTPVIRLPDGTAALLMVGAPTREGVSNLCGRLMMEAVRCDARTLVVDFTGCSELPEASWDVWAELAGHRKLADRRLILCAPPADLWRHLQQGGAPGGGLERVPTWPEVLAALEDPG